MKLKLLPIMFAMVFIIPFAVNAYGVTRPLPYEMELLRGESSNFKFQIQIVASESQKSCSYVIKEGFPLQVEFQDPNILLAPGERKDIVGTITVPRDISFGKYTGNVCIRCTDAESQGGTSVQQDVCSTLPSVDVVAVRTKGNMVVPGKQNPFTANLALLLTGIALFIVLIAIVFYIMHRKRR